MRLSRPALQEGLPQAETQAVRMSVRGGNRHGLVLAVLWFGLLFGPSGWRVVLVPAIVLAFLLWLVLTVRGVVTGVRETGELLAESAAESRRVAEEAERAARAAGATPEESRRAAKAAVAALTENYVRNRNKR